MRDRRQELGDAEVVVVTFARPRVLAGYRRRYAEPFTVVSDEERLTYRGLGFGRGSFWQVWSWKALKKYVELLRKGHRIEKPAARAGKNETDTRQLGGNAIVGRDGRLAWVYPGSGPDDRPSVDELVAAVQSSPRAGS